MEKLSKFAANHGPLAIVIHIWLTAALIFTGPDLLEPLAATWFWAPLVAIMLSPDRYGGYMINRRAGLFVERHFRTIFFVNWALSVTLLPFLLWRHLCAIDSALHAARDGIGAALGLGGQTGLVLTVASILTVVLLLCELNIYRRHRRG